MALVELSFNVHCHRPPWSTNHLDRRFSTSRYRVYVDKDLITERTWIWGNDIVIAETLLVDIDPEQGHNLKIEPVTYIPEQAIFKISDFRLLNCQGQTNSVNDVELYFVLA
jgi:hypothetical protein